MDDQNKDKNDNSRRTFLKSSGLALGLASTYLASSSVLAKAQASANKTPENTGFPLSVASYNFNRTAALFNDKVAIEGCATTFEAGQIGDMNTEIFSGGQSRDVSEVGLHPFMIAYANGGFRDYTLLPIFLLRIFRHKSIFINTDSGILSPKDLKGKKIATPGYSSTSLTWIRGMLQDEYGIKPEDIHWVLADKDSSAGIAGKISKQESMIPDGLKVSYGTAGKDESELLLSGEVDAIFHAAEPKAFIEGHPKVARLFSDSKKVEQDFYQKTGVFPIMHAVAIKSKLLAKEPWLAKALFDAFSKAKMLDYQKMNKIGWVEQSLPWFAQELAETKKIMGDNFYSYGFDDANKKTLETLFKYSHEQGLTNRELKIEELFSANSLELIE